MHSIEPPHMNGIRTTTGTLDGDSLPLQCTYDHCRVNPAAVLAVLRARYAIVAEFVEASINKFAPSAVCLGVLGWATVPRI